MDRWEDGAQRGEWYEKGKAYWASTAATNDGVLGGYGAVHSADIEGSLRFLKPLWPLKSAPRETCALDVGAGIGRVSGALLLQLCSSVDLIEGCSKFVEQARHDLRWAGERMRYICADMQSFEPPVGRYHLLWVQWCIGSLTDDDLVEFLRRCRAALAAEGGLIVLKDNVIDEADVRRQNLELDSGRFLVDEADKSVIRTRPHLLQLLERAGLQVVAHEDASLGREDLQPVTMIALR